ncbi:MAG: NTP transferase domain-containing protein [Chitinophagaceae bacterium]|nr:NTP transferase domain-containing protein [Chitinophagaceae bacterium]
MVTAELNTAMIFAAGLGTRLKPWTDHHPKALALVNGKPLLQRNIEYLNSFGINNLVINVHHFADQVIAFLEKNNNFGCAIKVSHEKEEALETGGGLKYAEPMLQNAKRFLIMNADILTDLNIAAMLQHHLTHNPLATLAVTNRSSSRCFLFNEKHLLCGWQNNKTGEERIAVLSSLNIPMAFSGIHIIEQSIFPLITETGKFSMVDLYLRLCKEQHIIGYNHSNDILVDVGKPESIAIAEKYFL